MMLIIASFGHEPFSCMHISPERFKRCFRRGSMWERKCVPQSRWTSWGNIQSSSEWDSSANVAANLPEHLNSLCSYVKMASPKLVRAKIHMQYFSRVSYWTAVRRWDAVQDVSKRRFSSTAWQHHSLPDKCADNIMSKWHFFCFCMFSQKFPFFNHSYESSAHLAIHAHFLSTNLIVTLYVLWYKCNFFCLCLLQKATACFSAGYTASKSAICTTNTSQKGEEGKIREGQKWQRTHIEKEK